MIDILSLYIRIFERALRVVKLKLDAGPLSIEFGQMPDKSYDKTLKKLDIAKQHMTEALQSLDTLRSEYTDENSRLDGLISAVQKKKQEFDQAKESLVATRELLAKDQAILRDALGINDRRSKIAGFISGVVASIIATAISISAPYVFKGVVKLMTLVFR